MKYRRVLLRESKPREGAFVKLFGPTEIELIQCLDKRRKPKKIFENRYWGDLGFIHLCFDVQGMEALKEECEAAGFPFTVDSADSFDMGEAAGRFTYIDDPDGTWIEFVETHKVPVAKKLGLFIDMTKETQKILTRLDVTCFCCEPNERLITLSASFFWFEPDSRPAIGRCTHRWTNHLHQN